MKLTNQTTTPTKICSQCRRELPVTAFHRRRHYVRSSHRAACKECTAKTTRLARARGLRKVDQKKQLVRARTREAIRIGKLAPLPCQASVGFTQLCDNPNVDAHHPDYDRPNAHLDVDWLCEKHHSLEHGKRAWTRQMELFPAMA